MGKINRQTESGMLCTAPLEAPSPSTLDTLAGELEIVISNLGGFEDRFERYCDTLVGACPKCAEKEKDQYPPTIYERIATCITKANSLVRDLHATLDRIV